MALHSEEARQASHRNFAHRRLLLQRSKTLLYVREGAVVLTVHKSLHAGSLPSWGLAVGAALTQHFPVTLRKQAQRRGCHLPPAAKPPITVSVTNSGREGAIESVGSVVVSVRF